MDRSNFLGKIGGAARNRTGDGGFADLCLTAWRRRRSGSGEWCGLPPPHLPAGGGWSGKRDSNPRLRPWQGRTLPLSYSRSRASAEPPIYYRPPSPCKKARASRTRAVAKPASRLQDPLFAHGRRGRASIVVNLASGGNAAAIRDQLPRLPPNRHLARRLPGVGSLLHLRHMWGALDRAVIGRTGLRQWKNLALSSYLAPSRSSS